MQLIKNFACILCCYVICCVVSFQASAWNSQVRNGKCKKSQSACSGTIGNAGDKSACCDPLSKEVSECVRTNPCEGGKPYLWFAQDLPVVWFFNPNGMPGKGGFKDESQKKLEDALKKAWDAWTKPSCTSFRHKYNGITTTKPKVQGSGDQKVVLYLPTPAEWALMGTHSSVLGFTVPRTDSKTGRFNDADIFFNPGPFGQAGKHSFYWGTDPVGQKEMDFTEVASHEIGHAIGFAHTEFTSSLMYFSVRFGGFGAIFAVHGLSLDEVKGVCSKYPKQGPCTKDSDCSGCQRCQNKVCVPLKLAAVRNLCKPCKEPSDCGGERDICIRMKEGNRCAQACDSRECCPEGYRCVKVGLGDKMCVPDAGSCPSISCKSTKDCGPGESCERNVCRPQAPKAKPKTCKTCQDKADCDSGSFCTHIGCGVSRCVQPCVAGNFCPEGYECQTSQHGRVCMPVDGVCPCKSAGDCDKDQICRSKTCQRKGGGTYCDICSDSVMCAAGYRCFQTEGYPICLQPCGENDRFPSGSPGSVCAKDKKCTEKSECLPKSGGGNICLKKCTSHATCEGSGRCYQLSSSGNTQNFCMCRDDKECPKGQSCNQTQLSKLGACAPTPKAPGCSDEYVCRSAGGSTKVCLPKSGQRDIGQSCDEKQICRDGLLCVITTQGSEQGVCIEDCTSSKKCKYGGECRKVTETANICLCGQSNSCPKGRTCKVVLPNSNTGVCQTDISSCQNRICEPDKGEDCLSCPLDCACKPGENCTERKCVASQPSEGPSGGDAGPVDVGPLVCAENEQILVCDEQLDNCKPVCAPKGCGCSVGTLSTESSLMLSFLCLVLWWMLFRRRRRSVY